MRGVMVNKTVDPILEEFYCEEGSHDCKFLHADVKATFYLRGSKTMLIQHGKIGGTSDGRNCKIGAAYRAPGAPATLECSDITIEDVLFHDITVSDPSQHNEAIAMTGVDKMSILGCRFERIWANTAHIFFAFEQNPTLCSNVRVLNSYFDKPLNGRGWAAMQWKDNNGGSGAGFKHFLIEGNLFDGSEMGFGTIGRPVEDFVVGVNYGQLSKAAYDWAVGKGVVFKEYPFRPASEWPGNPPIVIPPIPPSDPCADVKAALATANTQIAALTGTLEAEKARSAALQTKIEQAVIGLTA